MARMRKKPGNEAVALDQAAQPASRQQGEQEMKILHISAKASRELEQSRVPDPKIYETPNGGTTEGTTRRTDTDFKQSRKQKKKKRRRMKRLSELAAREHPDSGIADRVQHGQTIDAPVLQTPPEEALIAPRVTIQPDQNLRSARCAQKRCQAAADRYGIQQARQLARMGASRARASIHQLEESSNFQDVRMISAPKLDEAPADQFGLQQARRLALEGAKREKRLHVPIQPPAYETRCSHDALRSAVTSSDNAAVVLTYVSDTAGDRNLLEMPWYSNASYKYTRIGGGYALGQQVRTSFPGLGAGDGDDSLVAETSIKQESIADNALSTTLSDEQKRLVDLVLEGRNVFYTGSAGTGKSTVLHAFVAALKLQGKRVFKVAPTGVAALNIGGQTYYSFAGWDKDSRKRSISRLEREARNQHRRWGRLNDADVLVIDEISMIDSHQMDRLDRICRAARGPSEELGEWDEYYGERARSPHDPLLPFGGMQLVVTGDFCQLPPVKPFKTCFPCGKRTDDLGRGIRRCEPCDNTFRTRDEWAFKSQAWHACDFTNVQLTEVHRQTDADLVAILEGSVRRRVS